MKSSFMCPPAPNSVVKQHHSRAGGTWAAPSNYGIHYVIKPFLGQGIRRSTATRCYTSGTMTLAGAPPERGQ